MSEPTGIQRYRIEVAHGHYRPEEPLLLIQCTVTGELNKRMRKDPDTCRTWLSTGNRLEFWGWALRGARGTRKTYVLTKRRLDEESVNLEDL